MAVSAQTKGLPGPMVKILIKIHEKGKNATSL